MDTNSVLQNEDSLQNSSDLIDKVSTNSQKYYIQSLTQKKSKQKQSLKYHDSLQDSESDSIENTLDPFQDSIYNTKHTNKIITLGMKHRKKKRKLVQLVEINDHEDIPKEQLAYFQVGYDQYELLRKQYVKWYMVLQNNAKKSQNPNHMQDAEIPKINIDMPIDKLEIFQNDGEW